MPNLKLKAAIVEKGLTLSKFAKEINMSKYTLNSKINGKTEFTESEIKLISDYLSLEPTSIFFNNIVAKNAINI